MAMKLSAHEEANQSANRDPDVEQENCRVSGEELLELLGDQYTRRVLQAVVDEPKSGSEVVDVAAVSKATAYRRLETLKEAGLIEAETVFDPDGHHHEQYRAVVHELSIEIRDGSLSADIRIDPHTSSEQSQPTLRSD